ncbi:MAG: helix-turn-helix transcriptional regulator, partial [Syntrophorhabdaceae bacterium]|nr:helix-turn-helix transcriptional regulator [Syntrophorhabdaceae bacterium]
IAHTYKEIGTRLKELRGDLSQAEFAAILSIKQQQYNRYETGRVKPPLNIVQKISEVRRVSVDWILTGKRGEIDGIGILETMSEMMETFKELEAIPKASVSDDELAIIKCLRLLSQQDGIEVLKEIISRIAKDELILRTKYQKEQLNTLKKIVRDDRLFTQGIDYEGLLWGYRNMQRRLRKSTKKENLPESKE